MQRKGTAGEYSALLEQACRTSAQQRACSWDTCCVQGPAEDQIENVILAFAGLQAWFGRVD